MNDDVCSLFVMKRSLKTEKNERKTFFWLEITEPRNDSQCSLAVSGDFCSLEELVIRLQMMFPERVLESAHRQCPYETCMIVKGIKQDVLRDCLENYKSLM